MLRESLRRPSARKLPPLAMKAPGFALGFVPLIEKAYVPLRLAFEKPPVGGGGVGKDEPLPPQETVSNASAATAEKISGFIAHPVDRRIWRRVAAGNLAGCAAPAPDLLSESPAPGTACLSGRARFRRERESCRR